MANLLDMFRQTQNPFSRQPAAPAAPAPGLRLPGQGTPTGLPTTAVTGGAPSLDFSNYGSPQYNASVAMAQAGNSMDAGWQRRGVDAFLDGDLNFFNMDWSPVLGQKGDTGNGPVSDEYKSWLRAGQSGLANLAQELGYDISGYDLNNLEGVSRFGESTSARNQRAQDEYLSQFGINQAPKGLYELYTDLNKDLGDYRRVRAASAGWDGRGDMRSTAETMYHQSSPNVWNPVSRSSFSSKPEHRGWAREEGAETLAGLSVVMPAFGGWAGLLGQGVGGTLTAGGGLGLTSGLSGAALGAANTGLNMLGNAAMTGNFSPVGALASLGMGAAGNLAQGSGLNNMFGNAANIAGSSSYNSLGQLMNSGVGQAIRGTAPWRGIGGNNANLAMRGISSLARLFS